MPFSPQTLEEKPYNLCINCAHIGKRCDGPNFLAMSTERWCEWCRLRKDYLGWTNAKVAELADVALVSVQRIMSGHVKDLRISTMQAVTKALVAGSWGQYPCVMAELAGRETVYVDNPDLVAKADGVQAECAQMRTAVNFLKDQLGRRDKAIAILAALLGVAVLAIIAALTVDLLHSGVGFFWVK